MVRIQQMPVMVAPSTHAKVKDMAERLSLKVGRPVPIKEVIDRAITCLEDANAGGAWLSPVESWDVMRDRVQRSITAVATSVIRRFMPDVTHVRCGFDPVKEEMIVEIDGDPGFMVKTQDQQTAMRKVQN